jgi:UDP-3-O-[3-hydroxymyristoyl] glucosamine N-acyltransferase
VIDLPWSISFAARTPAQLVERHGGSLRGTVRGLVRRVAPVERAAAGDLAPLLRSQLIDAGLQAAERGALLLVDAKLAQRSELLMLSAWVHEHASWALACVLDTCDTPNVEPKIGADCMMGQNVVIEPRVVIGRRVRIDHGTVIGRPGFGWATAPDGRVRAIPQLGGVVIEDDVDIGPLCTIDSGTLGPTIIRRGVKIDAQVHIGHNCDIGEDTMIAAQCGFAGSVVVGKGVLFGGQVGVADHVRIGDRARIAGQSGVIGDVAPGATVAGYPAVARARWLRGLAELYKRGLSGAEEDWR